MAATKAKKAAAKAENKMAATSNQAPALTTVKADADIVQEAYQDSLKESLNTYFLACIQDPKTAEERFLTGLSIIRTARDRAIQLV